MEESKQPSPQAASQSSEASTWLWYIAVCGSMATVAYALLAVLSGPDWLAVLIVFAFAAGLSVGSVAIWQLLSVSGLNTPVAMLAATSNVVAGALFVAMALVQIAVKSVADPPDEVIRSVYWGLDVAWDLYVGAGTLGFAVAFAKSASFQRWSIPGIVIALALIALNVASFPEPPASAGLVDVGPLVGLWYASVAVRAIFLLRAGRHVPAPGVETTGVAG